ncbi:ribonuclease P protein subunit p40-like [Mya arenaria]|uniref:ribonuclease P protein subunit p40-like n=1 Tax=Mya arenaria TaxID=6604 RepID=UPI0022E76405|nr:ribonuclease P protein subunit p40-like [Mya arenaria]
MAAPMENARPTGKLVFERSSFTNEKAKYKKCIEEIPFTYSIQILLPAADVLPAEIDAALSEEQAFLARNVPVSLLLHPDFIHGFIKAGSVYMLSHGTCIDKDDCLALQPDGVLVLSLSEDTYHQLGLEGRRANGRYVVEVDLLGKLYTTSDRYRQRVTSCLTDHLTVTFDLLTTWSPTDEKLCPSSIQNFFKKQHITCNRLKLHKKVLKYMNFLVPDFTSESFQAAGDQDGKSCDHYKVVEWLGACALGLDMSTEANNSFVSSYRCPSPHQELPCGVSVQYTGMFTTQTVQMVLNNLRRFLHKNELRWCSVTVHGYQDTPVTWQHDHGFHSNGDNLYTFVIFKNEEYWQYQAIGPIDTCP